MKIMSDGFQKQGRWAGIAGLLMILMTAGSCARQTFQDLQPPETVPSVVKAQIPAPHSTDARLHTPIQVVFTKGMDAATVTSKTFYIQDAAGNSVPGTVTYSSRAAQIFPTDGLSFQATYTATMTTDVADPAGKHLPAPVVWSFTTEKPPLIFDVNVRVTDYAPAAFSAGSFSAGECSLVQSGGTIDAVWYDYRSGSAHIYFAKSTDGGATFGPVVKVDDDISPKDHLYPCMTADAQGNLYVAWHDRRNGDSSGFDIYFAKSTDGGATFGPNVQINDDVTSTDQTTASIAVGTDGTIYVAWRDYRNQILDAQGHPTNADIYVSTSTNGGLAFSPNVKANDDTGTADQNHPTIAVDSGGKIYLAWTDQRNRNTTNPADIYFATGTGTGAGLMFNTNILINDDTVSANQHDPSLRIGPNGEVLIMWVDHRNGGVGNIYFSESTDGGVTFSPNIEVSEPNTGGQDVPSLAVNASGLIVVTWQNSTPQPDGSVLINILATTSTDGGASFHSSVIVNDDTNGAKQRQSNVAIDDSGQVYVIWTDERNGIDSGNFDIYFAKGQ